LVSCLSPRPLIPVARPPISVTRSPITVTQPLIHLLLLFRPHCLLAYRRGCGIRPHASGKVLVQQVAGECTRITAKIARSNRSLKRYAGKAGATVKSPKPNAGNAVGYGYAGKAGAFAKSVTPNAGNAVRYGFAVAFLGVAFFAINFSFWIYLCNKLLEFWQKYKSEMGDF